MLAALRHRRATARRARASAADDRPPGRRCSRFQPCSLRPTTIAADTIDPEERDLDQLLPAERPSAGRSAGAGSDARTHTVPKSSTSTFTMNQKIGMIQTLTSAGRCDGTRARGPDGPPRNSVTAIADIVMTFMNSARKKIAKRMPVYSVWKPPTSSCSASTRSNGGWFVSAIAAIRKMTNAHDRGQPVPVARRTSASSIHACWSTIAARRERARLDEHAEDREAERGLVREQLRRRAHRAEQRVLRARRPAREHHAVHADARHREDEQHADRQIGDLQVRSGARRSRPSPPIGTIAEQRGTRAGSTGTARAGTPAGRPCPGSTAP